MSISNYGELKTATENWLHRTDLTSRIPEFISIAEAKIANDVRCNAQQTRSTADVSTQYFDVPTGYLEIRDIHVNSDPIQPLTYLTPKVLSEKFPSSTTGKPKFYTIHGDEIEVKPVPSTTYEIEINYIKRFTAFSDDADYNWLLTNQPHIYLYAALISANEYTEDTEQLTKYQTLYNNAINTLNKSELKAKHGNILVAKVNTPTP